MIELALPKYSFRRMTCLLSCFRRNEHDVRVYLGGRINALDGYANGAKMIEKNRKSSEEKRNE